MAYLEDRNKSAGVTAPADPLKPYQQHLLAAAELIETHGLAKETQRDSKGSMCLHGALSVAIYGRPYEPTCWGNCEASDAVRAQLLKMGWAGASYGYHAADWNNAPERTAAEVIDLLTRAAFDGELPLSRALAIQGAK